jgi:hypothetical protein
MGPRSDQAGGAGSAVGYFFVMLPSRNKL